FRALPVEKVGDIFDGTIERKFHQLITYSMRSHGVCFNRIT
ncbi:MAG: hypothetical protein ACI9NC_000938, partial [Verrucomicrobiales bacterium]